MVSYANIKIFLTCFAFGCGLGYQKQKLSGEVGGGGEGILKYDHFKSLV